MLILWQAYWGLLSFEYPLFRKDFSALYERVRMTPVATRRDNAVVPAPITQAVDLAAVLYFKQILCLQRSAATACLLRKHGFPAELVVGVQHVPFLAHAWVELDGSVVNDKPYMTDIYSVLTRC
jgi:hypothetical protein